MPIPISDLVACPGENIPKLLDELVDQQILTRKDSEYAFISKLMLSAATYLWLACLN